MQTRIWLCTVLGLVLALNAACEPIDAATDVALITPSSAPTATDEPTETPPPTERPSPTAVPSPTATATPSPTATPEPAPTVPADWRPFGSAFFGLQMAAPNNWIDFTPELRSDEVYKAVGPRILFITDSEATGNTLFSGEPLDQGAYVLGYLTEPDSSDSSPEEALMEIVTRLRAEGLEDEDSQETTSPDLANEPLRPATFTLGDITGATVNLNGLAPESFPLFDESAEHRLAVLKDPEMSVQAVLLMGSANGSEDIYRPTFDTMLENIILRPANVNVLGHLASGEQSSSTLTIDEDDFWTFEGESGRYATITLVPEDNDIDLTLTLIEPAGAVSVGVDDGYAGDLEVLTDVPLSENGTYIIRVGEFFNEPGRYELNLVLSDEPQSNGSGRIAIGQEITSELDEDGEHAWIFEGTAGKSVTIILSSLDNQLDVILELRGPLGRELATLDEGFAGDAEVLTGVELPVTGEYEIIVRGFAERQGVYSLSLDEGAESTDNFYDAGDLLFGDNERETLREDEAHAWFFTGVTGDEITIEVEPLESNLDMDVWLLDADLQQLVKMDENLSGEAETLEYTLTADDQYLVLVREFFGEPGDYEIALNVRGDDVLEIAGTLSYSQTVSGELDDGQSVGWTFSGQAEDIVDVTLTPTDEDRDLLILLLDSAGNPAITVDAALSGLSERLVAYELGETGQWTIVVQEFFSEGSGYELTLIRQE